jgi:hypothetical protein
MSGREIKRERKGRGERSSRRREGKKKKKKLKKSRHI